MRCPLDLYRTTRLLASNTKALEAQVFRRVLYQLETATQISGLEQAKALADLRLLWVTVLGLVTDPDNHLSLSVQKSLEQLSQAVLAELDLPAAEQNKSWLIEVTTQIAEGLEG
jgi:flagellar biosynthesis regulator FlaF